MCWLPVINGSLINGLPAWGSACPEMCLPKSICAAVCFLADTICHWVLLSWGVWWISYKIYKFEVFYCSQRHWIRSWASQDVVVPQSGATRRSHEEAKFPGSGMAGGARGFWDSQAPWEHQHGAYVPAKPGREVKWWYLMCSRAKHTFYCLIFNQPQCTLTAPSPVAGKWDLENSLKFPDWFFLCVCVHFFLKSF